MLATCNSARYMSMDETTVPSRQSSDQDIPPTSSSSNVEKADPLELTRTKSIVETLSLPHEIVFVAIVCSAQLLTRESCSHPSSYNCSLMLSSEAGLGNVQTIVHIIGDHFGLSAGELPW